MLNGFVQFVLGRSGASSEPQDQSTSTENGVASSVSTEMTDGVDGEWILVEDKSRNSACSDDSASVDVLEDTLSNGGSTSLKSSAFAFVSNLPSPTDKAGSCSRKKAKPVKDRVAIERRSTRVRSNQSLLAAGGVMRRTMDVDDAGRRRSPPAAVNAFPVPVRCSQLAGVCPAQTRKAKIKRKGLSGSNNDRKNQYY